MGTKFYIGAATPLLTVLLAFISPCLSQDIEMLQKGVVKVTTTTLEGNRKVGTGFVVRLGVDVVYIVTAAHVVEGTRDVKVEFFTGRNRLIPAVVFGLEGGDRQGLAILSIEVKIPPGISVLKMNRVTPVRAGDPVTMIGFPDAGGPWAVTKGEIVGRKGKTIAFSGAVDEGNSGGPLIKEGQVIGVVTEALAPFAYATPAVIAQYVLESWGVKFGDQLRSKPANVEKGHVVQMIREKGFHHPGNLSHKGFSGSIRGNFEHEYELKTLNGDTVVIDHATDLMWQQSGSLGSISWGERKGYIDEINKEGHAGFSDWRLPTIEELASLLEPIGENEGLYIDPVFDKRNTGVWSADRGSESVWVVDFSTGTVFLGVGRWPVRGVRSTQGDPQQGTAASTPKPTPTEVKISSQLANTKIAFVSMVDNHREIHAMNADGSNLTRLALTNITHEGLVSRPAWSPDGTQIAFTTTSTRSSYPKWDIYVMHADGTNLRSLTQSKVPMTWPTWSPDGTQIAFALWHNCDQDIYVMHADGSNQRRLTDMKRKRKCSFSEETEHAWWSPVWSPDGTKIALRGRLGSPAISVINADGSQPRSYGPVLTRPSRHWWLFWSPDGTKISFIFDEDRRIYVMNADGTNLQPLSQAEVDYSDINPGGGSVWSPDGAKIAFVSRVPDHGHGNQEIYVINADGTNLRRLTDTPAGDVEPSWSPDGTKIAFASRRNGQWKIYVMNADGTNPSRLTNNAAYDAWPSWSPILK